MTYGKLFPRAPTLWYRRETPATTIERQRLFGLSRQVRRLIVLMRKTTTRSVPFLTTAALVLALVASSCLPKPPAESGDITITLYGFSIMKESLEKSIFPGFTAKWKQQHGQVVQFQSSFAGSETITNQILQGAPSEIAISIERDAQRLRDGGFVIADWRSLPSRGIINKTPLSLLSVREIPRG